MDHIFPDSIFSSLAHQRACATILAYAAKTYLPILEPIASTVTSWGFSCDFICKTQVDAVILTLLSEEMRRSIGRDMPFTISTMVPNNARDFLGKSQPLQAALLDHMDAPLIDLVKLDTFYDISFEPCLDRTKELDPFALLSVETKRAYFEALGEIDVVRIHGTVCPDKKTLKSYIKEWEKARKEDPVVKAREQKLLVVDDGNCSWYPEGVLFYEQLVKKWSEVCRSCQISVLKTPPHMMKQYHELFLQDQKIVPARSGEWTVSEHALLPQECEGLFQTKQCQQDFVFRYCKVEQFEQELISSLQFLQQLHSINGVETVAVFVLSKARKMLAIQERMKACIEHNGYAVVEEESSERNAKPRLELRVRDLRGRQWLFAFVEVELKVQVEVEAKKAKDQEPKTQEMLLLTQSAFVSAERLLAVSLERGGYKKA